MKIERKWNFVTNQAFRDHMSAKVTLWDSDKNANFVTKEWICNCRIFFNFLDLL